MELRTNNEVSHRLLVKRMFHGQFWEIAAPVGVFFLALGWFFIFARLDPDLHHDGLMLAAATAARDGLVIHRDVFQFHGAPISILQAWIAPIDGPNILSIRLLNAVLAAGTAMLLTFSRYVGVPAVSAYGAALLWIFLANFGWTNEPPIAMSAVLASTLLVGAFLLISRYLSAGSESHRQGVVVGYFGGLLLGFLILTRINVGLLALFASTVLIIIFARFQQDWCVMLPPLGGALSPLLVLIVYYLSVDGLASLWNDVVVYPRTYHANAIFRENIQPFISGERSLLPLAVLGFGGLALLTASSRRVRAYWSSLPRWTKSPASKWLAVLALVLLLLLVTFTYVTRKGVPFFSTQGASQSMRFLMWALLGLAVASAAWFLLSSAREFFSRKTYSNGSTKSLTKLYLALMALSGLSILVPWLGPRYVWWGIPLGLLVLCWTIWSLPFRQRYKRLTLIALVSITILGALFASRTILSVPREVGNPSTPLAGMLIERSTAATLNARFTKVEQVHQEFGSLISLCKDSAYAVVGSSYASHNKYHLFDPNWFPLPEITAGVAAAVQASFLPVILCDSLSSDWGQKLDESNSFNQISTIGPDFHIFVPAKSGGS